jgi:hypothetical protein
VLRAARTLQFQPDRNRHIISCNRPRFVYTKVFQIDADARPCSNVQAPPGSLTGALEPTHPLWRVCVRLTQRRGSPRYGLVIMR